jgi:CBS domain-containing protein
MQLIDVLTKNGASVVSIAPDLAIQGAAKMMAQHSIGAAVVVDGSLGIAGILSERDITRAVGEHGGKIDALHVEDLMVKDVITCPSTCNIAEAMQIMQSNRIRHLPVLAEDDKLVGMVSMRDMMELCLGDMMGMGL